MTEWQPLVLGEVLARLFDRRGITPRKLKADWADSGVQVISAKLVSDGRLHLDRERRYVAPDVYDRWMPEGLRPDDVLLTSEAPLGEAARVTGTVPLCLGQRLFALRPNPKVLDARFLYYWLRSASGRSALAERSSGTTVLGIRQAELVKVVVPAPCVEAQRTIADVLGALDDLIENNRRRVEVLEEMARAIYREWFVHFRYPGHEHTTLVDSPLGPIPEGWQVEAVASLASSERNAVTGGPFGSKLGRKDYVDAGVPVIRGANLRVGGGFEESELIFVSEVKAKELRSSLTRRGDVVVTQRGTLGQVGLIPLESRFDRYLLSQSQMKITVDPEKSSAEFVYSQLRTPDTTQRFIAQAMSSGVPHVNLALLRNFELLVPPHSVQLLFTDRVRALDRQSWTIRRQAEQLVAIRDLLLPRLVTGRIDVSSLDLDALVEGAVA